MPPDLLTKNRIGGKILSMRSDFRFLSRARFAREVICYFAQGKNLFDICELMADYFENKPWAAYDAILPIYRSEKAKKAYARAYLVRALADAGFKNTQISKIAGYTPQRCGQILKKAI